MARYCKVGYGGTVKTVALFPGLDSEELNKLMQSVFSIPNGSSVVGLLAEVCNLIYFKLSVDPLADWADYSMNSTPNSHKSFFRKLSNYIL